MYKRILFFLFLVVQMQILRAQTETVVLSRSMFQRHDRINLAPLDGWIFRQGNDSSWAAPEIDLSQWKSFRPDQLNTGMADKSGRVEGWFRIKIKPDSSFAGIRLGIAREMWAATDVYIDGKLLHRFGHTGDPYTPYNPSKQHSVPVSLIPGREYFMAMHYVNYESLFTQRELRMKPEYMKSLLMLTGPAYDYFISGRTKNTYLLGASNMAVASLLLLLFILLLVLNRGEKIFQFAVLLTITVVISAWSIYYSLIGTTTYGGERLRFIIANGFSLPLMHGLTLLITEWVLKRRISWITKSIVMAMPVASFIGHIFNISWPFGLLEMALLAYFIFLVASSWKTNRGAEWIVVLAMTVLTLGSLFWVFLHKYYLDAFNEYEEGLRTIVLLSAPILLLVYVAMSYRKILAQKQEESEKVIRISREKELLLAEQNELLEKQVAQRTKALELSLAELKSAQAQLIQSEKMASLGELTAGIAHEIQNPLNFVNNFSEVSEEMIVEAAGSRQEAGENSPVVTELLTDIKQNLAKINQHGKRADAIVKGMLQHSRSTTGNRELTDVNDLVDEYVKLSFHAFRGKDNAFDVNLQTDFDPAVGTIELAPQEVGRVLLNILNNAFYAVNERRKKDPVFSPEVIVQTKKTTKGIEISAKDNGGGIPENIVGKIFQPFFTTKPTGQGTGLGLSLSYDIVKAHGGELKVETKEGEGSEFIILLPI
jgi:signal transduction histidine kinase